MGMQPSNLQFSNSNSVFHIEASSRQQRASNEPVRTPVVQISRLTKTFRSGRKALSDIALNIEPGQMVALIGASGSGKSTLLRNLAGLTVGDRASGEVRVLGRTVQRDGIIARDIRKVRSRIGFVFQQFNLVDRLSLLTNVLAGTLGRVPMWRSTMCWFTRSEKKMAVDALALVGIAEYASQRASTLSGGQQQRAAIARALVQQAEIILADEPIASLDPEASVRVMEILSQINRENGITVIVSLHQVEFALKYCSRVVALRDGQIVYDGSNTDLTPNLLREIYCCQDSEPKSVPMKPSVVAMKPVVLSSASDIG
ncbi:MAG: phosphonate ABC transporter ATP-binding protein [Candidatus Korobacteraceae bacterium]